MVVATELRLPNPHLDPAEAIRVGTLPPEALTEVRTELAQVLNPELSPDVEFALKHTVKDVPPLRGLRRGRKSRQHGPDITIEDVKDMQEEFGSRFRSVAFRLANSGTLDEWCNVLIESGKIKTKGRRPGDVLRAKRRALRYLNDYLDQQERPQIYINRGIIFNDRVVEYAKTETRRLRGTLIKNPVAQQERLNGGVVHVASLMFERRDMCDPAAFQSHLAVKVGAKGQLSIFEKAAKGDWTPVYAPFMLPGGKHVNDVTMYGEPRDRYTYSIEDGLRTLQNLKKRRISKEMSAAHFMSEAVPVARELLYQFSVIVPPDVMFRLLRDNSIDSQFLMVDTIMAISHKYLATRDGGRQLVREELAPIITTELSGGRVDTVKVAALNSRRPADQAIEWAKHTQFDVTGRLVHQAGQRYGSPNWSIWERKTKFSSPKNVLNGEAYVSPLSRISREHLESQTDRQGNAKLTAFDQLEDYLTKTRGGIWIVDGGKGEKWQGELRGTIEWLTADGIHVDEVVLNAEDQERVFSMNMAKVREKKNAWKAQTQDDSVVLLRHIRSLITGKESRKRRSVRKTLDKVLEGNLLKRRSNSDELSTLFEDQIEVDARLRSEEELHASVSYLNPELKFGVLVGRGKQSRDPVFKVKFPELAEKLEDGTFESWEYDEGVTKFFMGCPNPKHHWEEHHTFHVNLEECFGHCFSCKTTILIDEKSLPEYVQPVAKANREISQQTRSEKEVVLTEEHIRFMKDAQSMFQKYFDKNPRAAEYLAGRSIDPEFAKKKGAGFGDARMCKDLLDMGWDIKHLVKYGIVGIRHSDVFIRFNKDESAKLSKKTPVLDMDRGDQRMDIAALVVKAGFAENQDQAVKLILNGAIEINGKKVDGNCSVVGNNFVLRRKSRYFKWNGRVTFPLVWRGMITSFYGRAIWNFHDEKAKNKGAHRKAKILKEQVEVAGKLRWTNSPQGAFNAGILSKPLDYLIVTEGTGDALSLMLMGFENVIGIIGTANKISLEEIAERGTKVYIALDADIPGTINTYRAFKSLHEAGLKQPIFNFSREAFLEFYFGSIRRENSAEPPLVSLQDLRRYREEGADFLKERNLKLATKDYNEMKQQDEEIATRLLKQVFESSLSPISMQEYNQVFGASNDVSSRGVVFDSSSGKQKRGLVLV